MRLNQTLKREQSISIYQNLQEISAELYHDVKYSGNIYKLDKNYHPDKDYSDSDLLELHQKRLDIYDEYFKVSDDKSFKHDLRNKKKSFSLLFAIKKGKDFIDLLEYMQQHEDYIPKDVYLEALSSISNSFSKLAKEYKYNHEKDLAENVAYNKMILGGLETRYKLEFKKEENSEDKDISEFYRTKAEIEAVLERDYIPLTINMLEWIAYVKQYKKRVKQIIKMRNGK
jgi:hypothetical protein